MQIDRTQVRGALTFAVLSDAKLQAVSDRCEDDGVVVLHLLQLGHGVRLVCYHQMSFQDLLRLKSVITGFFNPRPVTSVKSNFDLFIFLMIGSRRLLLGFFFLGGTQVEGIFLMQIQKNSLGDFI